MVVPTNDHSALDGSRKRTRGAAKKLRTLKVNNPTEMDSLILIFVFIGNFFDCDAHNQCWSILSSCCIRLNLNTWNDETLGAYVVNSIITAYSFA